MKVEDVLPAVVIVLAAIIVLVIIAKSVVLVRQAETKIVERLGKYRATLPPGLHLIVPIVDKVRYSLDMREQVVVFQPQSVITKDNLVVTIDSVVYYQISNAGRATYEIQDFLVAIEQLSVTTLRNIIGTMDLETALTSRDSINGQLRTIMDETTGNWGVRVGRVELRAINPPQTIQQAMEMQMKAERERRAVILNAEGIKAAQVLTAEGEKQAAILRAEGARTAAILRAEGESAAIRQVTSSIKESGVDERVLAYKQLENQPLIAEGQASKIWLVPTELSGLVGSLAAGMRATRGPE